MSDEIKSLIEAQGTALTELRAKLEAKADAVVSDEIKKLNGVLDGIADQMKAIEKRAARPAAGAGDLSPEEAEHKAAFTTWMRKGEDSGLAALEAKAFNITANADGGFAVPLQIDTTINKRLVDISPVRSVAQVINIGTSQYRKLVDLGGTASGWVGETAARPETNTPTLASVVPTMGELYANPFATQVMLDDVQFNAEAWLSESVAEEFARAEGAAFITGNGTNRPTGFLAGPAPLTTGDAVRAFGTLQCVVSAQAAALPTSVDTFITLVHSLKAGHRNGAVFMMNRTVLAALRSYKDTTNQYLWQPSLQAGVPSTFLGYPVIEAEDMPVVGTGNFPIAFGNFQQGYLIVDRMGTRVLRDPFSNKPYIGFYTTKRVGGIVQNSEAIKLLRISAT